ncbi:MAG: carbohydrate kinase family protein [Planctomycetota bacterium]
MESEKNGILFGGNLVVDRVKIIDVFPKRGTLVNILSQDRSTGGAPLNNSINIKALDPRMKVAVLGCIGDDEDGRFVRNALRRYKINPQHIKVTDLPTSFTDVFTEKKNGARTFFHCRGANVKWGYDDIDFAQFAHFRIVHIGYILILDAMDAEDSKYGTVLARTFAKFRSLGVKTAVDVVSDLSGDFKKKVTAALKYTDYLILNEIEAGETTGIQARDHRDVIIKDNVVKAAERLLNMSETTEIVVIHTPEGACGIVRGDGPVWVDSFRVPPEHIKGTAGAGDAFASGILYALHEHKPLEEAMRLAHGMAARCLYSTTCTGGAVSLNAIKAFMKRVAAGSTSNYRARK